MKKLFKIFLFGSAGLGLGVLSGESGSTNSKNGSADSGQSSYTSLRKQSPFGDQAPKPEPPKKVADTSKKQNAEPAKVAKPKAPERKISVSGFYVDNNGGIIFSVVDKTDKDPVFQQVSLNGTSPRGYSAKGFNQKSHSVVIIFGGNEYRCVIGEEKKETSSSSSKSNNSGSRNNNYSGKGSSGYADYGYGSYNNNPYYFLDDDWDDWDDDDW